jgi:glycosyltransferase involved in cell wall biosynthesis
MVKHALFVAPSAYPLGGIATWLDYLVPGLRDKNWRVTLGLVQGRFHDVESYLEAHPEDQVFRIPCETGTREGRVRQLVKALRRVRPDIVVSVNVADVSPAVARLRASRKCSPRLATALHALQADLIRSLNTFAEMLDGVICTNRLACELVRRETSIPSDCVYYAPYGVNIASPTIAANDGNGVLRIGYVGRLERPQKRIQDVPLIVAELERRDIPYELLIAGDGPDEQWLRGQLSEAVSRGRILLLGPLKASELVQQVYRRVHAMLVTSFWETGPIVAWEAMANGVNVVTSAYLGSGLENGLKHGDNCLMFPIGDSIAAVDCLQRLQDARLRNRLLNGAYELVNNCYSTRISIERWNSALLSIVARPRTPTPKRIDEKWPPPAGRLDKLFGPRLAETIRGLLGSNYHHSEPGGEWPHAFRCSATDETAFWKSAISLEESSRHRPDRSV